MTILAIILLSVFCISFAGIAIILFRKIPILVSLPETAVSGESLACKIKKEVAKIPGVKNFDSELYLQKMLSRIRILTLKTEQKTGSWLERLRQRRNGHNHDSAYWEELKKAKDGK